MGQVPFLLSLLFSVITLITLYLFYLAANSSKAVLWIALSWLSLQGTMSLAGFYEHTAGMPPRFALTIVPPIIGFVALFLSGRGRSFLDGLSLRQLTLLHVIRIPVEIGLYGLYLQQTIPEIMTFEGRNFDVLSGLSAPVIFYFAFYRKAVSWRLLLGWNIVCLGLLMNIVTHAVLAAPFDFQQFAFDQPNRAVFYFPFVWLPSCIVPIVMLSHLAAIRQLLHRKDGAFSDIGLGPDSARALQNLRT